MRQRMLDCAPAIRNGSVQHNVVAIFAPKKKALRDCWVGACCWRELGISRWVADRDDFHRLGHNQFLPAHQVAENGAHLLETGDNFVALFLASIGKHEKVVRADA